MKITMVVGAGGGGGVDGGLLGKSEKLRYRGKN